MKLQIPLVIAVLVVNAASPAYPKRLPVPARKADVEILVPIGAKDPSASSKAGLPTPRAQENYNGSLRRFSWGDTPTGLRSLFPDRQIRRITVIRYVAGWDAQTQEVVRRKLFELTRRELEPPMSQILWSEMTTWSIQATMEFSEGSIVQILTDGSHTCVIDEAGKPWFFRISPAEFQCGFEIPGSTVRNDARSPLSGSWFGCLFPGFAYALIHWATPVRYSELRQSLQPAVP